jgi:hypothetical protein
LTRGLLGACEGHVAALKSWTQRAMARGSALDVREQAKDG